jgi:hypothetical protein
MSSLAAPLGGAEDVLRGDSDGRQVSVVDRAAVQLLGKHAELVHPGELAGDRGRRLGRHHDYSLDDLNCGPPRGCSAFLLPDTLPASVRAPLWDGSTRPRADGTAAPAAGRGGGPSRTAAHGSRCRPPARCAVLASHGARMLMTTLTLTFSSASAIVVGSSATHASQVPHQGAWTRPHESGRPECMRCDGVRCCLLRRWMRTARALRLSAGDVLTHWCAMPGEVDGAGSSGALDCLLRPLGLPPGQTAPSWHRNCRRRGVAPGGGAVRPGGRLDVGKASLTVCARTPGRRGTRSESGRARPRSGGST